MSQKAIIFVIVAILLIGGVAYFFFLRTPVSPTPAKIIKVTIGLIPKEFSPDFYPKVSADSSKIVFWKSGEGKPEERGLWIMNTDGSGLKQLVADNVVGGTESFQWSPIVDTHYNERYVFYIVNKEISKDKTARVLKVVSENGEYVKELTTSEEEVAFPRWVSITEIAFLDRNQNNKLKIVDIGGRRPVRQGSEIALIYSEYRDNALDKGVVKSVTFDGDIKQLTPDTENGAFPVLSQDKKKVAYLSFGFGPQKIMVVNIDGSGKMEVASGGDNPAWSFDSSKIAYNLAEEDHYNIAASDIYVVNVDGSGRKKVETEIEQGPALNPQWFPDGKHIVFDYSDKGIGTIAILSVE